MPLSPGLKEPAGPNLHSKYASYLIPNCLQAHQ
jgi:hypothetical protein